MPLKFQLAMKGKKNRNVLGLSLSTPSSPSPSSVPPPPRSTTSEASDKSLSSNTSIPNTPVSEVCSAGNRPEYVKTTPRTGFSQIIVDPLVEDGEGEPINRDDFVGLVSDTKHKFRPGDTELDPNDLEMLGILGAGVSGVVEKVNHRPTNMIMARKLIHIELKPSVRKQIVTELRVLHEVKSPYVVGFYGSFFVNDDLSIFMEYMDAGSLETIYRTSGAIPESTLQVVAKSVLLGLEELRENHQIVHRDIKPSNILMNTKGEVKLCDFGVSGQLVNSIAQTFTGTRSYMAPERLLGAKYAVQSDVWSLGLSLFEMAVGRFPVPPEGSAQDMAIFELMEYIVNCPAPTLPGSFSCDFQDFVSMCLVKDASKRSSPSQLLRHSWLQGPMASKEEIVAWVKSVPKSTSIG